MALGEAAGAHRPIAAFFWTPRRRNVEDGKDANFPAMAARRGAAMTDRSDETLQDVDMRNLARLVSACTLGLWAFAVGLLIGTFLFS
jgi:hypothetical protein